MIIWNNDIYLSILYLIPVRPQSIDRFMLLAMYPNAELKNPTFLGWKNEDSRTANMWF